jgi:hypothetical protein
MPEEGTLSIVRRGTVYQIRYASTNPYDPERPPYVCPDEETLTTVLHHFGLEAAAIHQACMAVQTGRVAVVRILVSPEQIQAFFGCVPPFTRGVMRSGSGSRVDAACPCSPLTAILSLTYPRASLS